MGAGGQQDTEAAVVPLIGAHGFHIPGQIEAGGLCRKEFRPEVLRLLPDGIRQGLAADFCDAGVVDHLMGNGNLPAELLLFQHQAPIPGPGQVEGGGEPRRAAANDDYVIQVVHQSCPTRSRLGFRVSAPGFQLAGQT